MYKYKTLFKAIFLISVICISLISCQDSALKKYEILLSQGNEYYNNGDYRNALSIWLEAKRFGLNQDQLLKKIASVHFKLADYKNAYKNINQLVKILPEDRDVLKLAVRINLIIGDLEAATYYMDSLKVLAPEWPDTHELFGEVMVFRKDIPSAKDAFLKCISLSPDNKIVAIKTAQCFLAMGEKDKAEDYLKSALNTKKPNSRLLALISKYYKLDNRYSKAEDSLLKAAELDKNNLAVKKELVEYYYETKRYDKAIHYVENVLETEKDNRLFKLLLVELLLMKNRFPEARFVLFDEDLAIEENLDTSYLKGKVHLMAGEYLAAIHYLNKVVNAQPSNITAKYLLSIAYLNNRNNHTAMATLMDILTISKDNNDVDLLISTVYYKNGEYPVSKKYAFRVIGRDPSNFEAHMIVGNCFLAQNRITDATYHFKKAQQNRMESIASEYFLAICNERTGNWKKALASYMAIIEKQRGVADVGPRCVSLALKHNKLKTISQFFLDQKEKHPDNGFYCLFLGDIFFAQGKIDKAIVNYENALIINPKIALAYFKLSTIYKKRKNDEKRLKVLNDAIKRHPNLINAYIELADVYRLQGDLQGAANILESALHKELKSPLLLNNYAYILMENGQFNKAFEIAIDAYNMDSKNAYCIDTLGWAYYHKKFYTQALWYLQEALRIEKDNAVIHYHLGLTLFAIKRKNEAYKHLKYALKNGLPDNYTSTAKEILDTITDKK